LTNIYEHHDITLDTEIFVIRKEYMVFNNSSPGCFSVQTIFPICL